MQINAREFFLGYRKVDMQPHEVLVRVLIPFTKPFEFVKEFKQAHRRDDDIAIVNAGMRCCLAKSHAGECHATAALCSIARRMGSDILRACAIWGL